MKHSFLQENITKKVTTVDDKRLLEELILAIVQNEFPRTKVCLSSKGFIMGCVSEEETKEILTRLNDLFGDDPNFPELALLDLRGHK